MDWLRIVPLGGLGEIGMNCLALESREGIVVIDCGVTFPREARGVDLIHPLFDYLEERADDVLGVVITHAHEDHVGAVPHLLKRVPVPVWAPPYALGLLRERLKEHPDAPAVTFTATEPRRRFSLGRFEVEPLRVTHSIPDSTALAIDTPGGRVLHTGDFKLEDGPLDHEATDRERFEALGREGVALLLSDSTNVDQPGWSGREEDVARSLEATIRSAAHRVVVGAFPSNTYRLQTLFRVAAMTRRKVCLLGRSVQNHARIASELGRLGLRGELLVTPDRVADVPRDQVLVVASGTQGEPQGSISRLSLGEHPRLKLQSGDTVVFSSRAIPGNDRAIWDMLCALERKGVDVRFWSVDPTLHVSGHAYREEQRTMLQWVQPRSFIPVHGTYHHLTRHAHLAREEGVGSVLVLENGETAFLDSLGLSAGASGPVGRVHLDDGQRVPDDVLRERSLLGETGVVTVSLRINKEGALVGAPALAVRGVVVPDPVATENAATEAARVSARDTLASHGPALELLRDAVRRAVRRCYGRSHRRPLVVVSLTEG
ncbi:MAG: ribonuclease J [Deltaproteobacteria bacterium]|nr:ribonuclease J [Deltaproteobacteria bacterium]